MNAWTVYIYNLYLIPSSTWDEPNNIFFFLSELWYMIIGENLRNTEIKFKKQNKKWFSLKPRTYLCSWHKCSPLFSDINYSLYYCLPFSSLSFPHSLWLLLLLLLLSRFNCVRLWQPHRWQPTRLLCPWDFPGKNTVVVRHCLLHGCS